MQLRWNNTDPSKKRLRLHKKIVDKNGIWSSGYHMRKDMAPERRSSSLSMITFSSLGGLHVLTQMREPSEAQQNFSIEEIKMNLRELNSRKSQDANEYQKETI